MKTIKLRDPITGIATREKVVSTAEVVALVRAEYKHGNRNPRLVAFVKWLDTFPEGVEPTFQDVAELITSHGGHITDISSYIENETN